MFRHLDLNHYNAMPSSPTHASSMENSGSCITPEQVTHSDHVGRCHAIVAWSRDVGRHSFHGNTRCYHGNRHRYHGNLGLNGNQNGGPRPVAVATGGSTLYFISTLARFPPSGCLVRSPLEFLELYKNLKINFKDSARLLKFSNFPKKFSIIGKRNFNFQSLISP